ncbi:NADPH-dependent FMN reductase [Jeotgalibacillus alimentarius]|uniref:NADPH-dependent FMN reductase n=1 Tax=Jeotgalibacillus alimentarius TaxID=135826 RepID=UPI000596D0F3|nr:NADPH-dependent FMN reductase [Jeotgalibacillus alimentarius]
MEPKRIVAMCGSLRKDSLNRKLLHEIIKQSEGKWHVKEAEIGKLPLFNEDIEAAGDPESVKSFRKKLKEADGVLIVTPEYNAGMPGGLKNALDWASRSPEEFSIKNLPVAIAGASNGNVGTALSQMQLRQTLTNMNANIMTNPKIIASRYQTKIDPETGRLTDESTAKQIDKFIESFSRFVTVFGE